MVSSLGYQLGKNKIISGFGVRRIHSTRRMTHGSGIARNALGSVISHVGHALVNKIASVVKGSNSGGSWKVTGTGRRIRRPRALIARKPRVHTGGYRRRTHRRAPRRLLF